MRARPAPMRDMPTEPNANHPVLSARGPMADALLMRAFAVCPDYLTISEVETGRIHLLSAGFTRLVGWTQAEASGLTVAQLGLWPDPEQRAALRERLRTEGAIREFTHWLRAKDGRLIPVVSSASCFEYEGVHYLVAVVRDTSESDRTRMEFEAIFENAHVGIALIREGRFQRTNARFEEMFCWPHLDIVGQRESAIWPSEEVYARSSARVARELADARAVDIEHELMRRDGSTIWCRMHGKAIDRSSAARSGVIWIIEDITDVKRNELALQSARRDAEAASRAKSAFLANMSHEIRTPLNAIVGLARIALAPNVRLREQRDHLQRILDSAEALQDMISGVLDLSKIEAGKLDIEHVAFDLHDLLISVHAAYAALAESRALSLSLDLDEHLPRHVRGDPLRVRQIVGNFVGNALKFTEHGGITLRAIAARNDRVRFEVVDTGIGIEDATRERLFMPFIQADQSTTRQYGGSGLGLAICRELASLMEGDVGVRSTLGQGSTFWAEIPLPPAQPPVSAAPEPEATGLKDVRVLLVEDNPINLLVAETMLAQWGMQVTTAEDGWTAVNLVEAQPEAFEVVLMDVHMPGMDGIEATRLIRRNFDAVRLPIIAQTAAALSSERQQCLDAGMNDFISKPIDVNRLHEVLRHWTRR